MMTKNEELLQLMNAQRYIESEFNHLISGGAEYGFHFKILGAGVTTKTFSVSKDAVMKIKQILLSDLENNND